MMSLKPDLTIPQEWGLGQFLQFFQNFFLEELQKV